MAWCRRRWTPLEPKMVASVDAHKAEERALLERIVNINSGTMNVAGVTAVKDGVAPKFEALGFKSIGSRWTSRELSGPTRFKRNRKTDGRGISLREA